MDFELLYEKIEVVALCLAVKGYQAEHPGCSEADANSYAVRSFHLYVEDAYEWLLDYGRRLMRTRNG
jgi:hypothetical protein